MITEQQKQQISTALNSAISKGIRGAHIAKAIGVNEAYITQLKKGVFYMSSGKGSKSQIPDTIVAKMAEYLGVDLDRRYWELCHTDQYITVEARLSEARDNSRVVAIIGSTGAGKTYGVDSYMSEHKNEGVYRITVGSLHKMGDVLDDLLIAMRLNNAKEFFISKGERRRFISPVLKLRTIVRHINDLKMSGEKPLIIIDEAENFKLNVFGCMKQLYDGLKGISGIAFVGTPKFVDKIEILAQKDRDGMPQFARRVKAGLRPPIDSDWTQQKRFMTFLHTIVDEQVIDLMRHHASNFGEVNDYIEPALREADKMGCKADVEFFRAMYGIV